MCMQLGDRVIKEHDIITVDGSTGEVYLGSVERRSAAEDEDFQTILKWADEMRELKVCVPRSPRLSYFLKCRRGGCVLAMPTWIVPMLLLDTQKVPHPPSFLHTLQVLTNADTPEQAATARGLGAQGIGLCRTEHMFFDPKRITAMRAMIVAEDKPERLQHLSTLSEFQRSDIAAMLK